MADHKTDDENGTIDGSYLGDLNIHEEKIVGPTTYSSVTSLFSLDLDFVPNGALVNINLLRIYDALIIGRPIERHRLPFATLAHFDFAFFQHSFRYLFAMIDQHQRALVLVF
jgi:hypothetical protein